MKVFITGASGFIGAHVTRALISRGHSVAVLAIPGDQLWRLQDILKKFEIKQGTLEDKENVRQTLMEFRPDACIHLAWYAEPGKYLHSPENISSLISSLGLLNELIRSGCQQVLMAGTCAEYEAGPSCLTEESSTRPATLYAEAKLYCGLLGRRLADLSKTNFAWGRIFYPYGPQEDERRLVPAVIRSLLHGKPFPATQGDQIRDYVHVEDVATAFCVMVEKQANGVFNISSSIPVTIRHLLETIGNLIGRENLIQFGALPYRDWEPPSIFGDSRRLKALGWKPSYTLVQGLQKTIQWWETNYV